MPARQRSRPWLFITTVGFLVVAAVLITAALVILDKPRFGWLVGRQRFLETVMIAIVTGAVAMGIGAWKSGARSGWRRPVLLAWAALAAASPAFGYMFVLPWIALALSSPAAIFALHRLWRDGPS